MTEIYDQQYIRNNKRSFSLRLVALLLVVAITLALYITSIFTPQNKWVTMAIAVVGVLVCFAVWVFVVSGTSAKRRMLRNIQKGLSTEAALTYLDNQGEQTQDGVTYAALQFAGIDESGRTFERTILFEGKPSFAKGAQVRLRTYRQLLVAYEIIE